MKELLLNPVIVFLNAWLMLAIVSEWPAIPRVAATRVKLRLLIEVVALALIDFGPMLVR